MNFRIGFGFDVHELQDGLDFWLGGIKVPHTKGGLGHSDADVLIHSICDALLGAANLGDIGKHFLTRRREWSDKRTEVHESTHRRELQRDRRYPLPPGAGRGLSAGRERPDEEPFLHKKAACHRS